VPNFPNVDFYLKDESVHPSGSLKHRLARSLFLYAVVNGNVKEGTVVIESSSGSTAVSEAYFASLLKLRFVAVMATGTSPQKVALIERYGGEAHFVSCAGECRAAAEKLACETGGHFMDQFTYAERATDFRSNNNLAASLFEQMKLERHAVPTFIVCGAGTGGTSATLGRFVRHRGVSTSVVVADPERSAFFDHFRSGCAVNTSAEGAGRIEGIGRPNAEPSFIRTAIDAMVRVPDTFSVGAMLYLERILGRRVGGSTGTIFCAALTLAEQMRVAGTRGSIVGILCDGGERYADTLYSQAWREAKGLGDASTVGTAAVAAFADTSSIEGRIASPWPTPPSPARTSRSDRFACQLHGIALDDAGPAAGGKAGPAAGGSSSSPQGRSSIPSRLGSAAWPMVITLRDDVAPCGPSARCGAAR
jgi:cysteine synthase A